MNGYGNQLDTLFLTSGNVTSRNEYVPDNLGYFDLWYSLQSVPSSYPNPAYSAIIANTIGGWIDFWINYYDINLNPAAINFIYLDFVSQNLPAGVASGCCFHPSAYNSVSFNWVTDSRGRVVKGTLPLPGNTITMSYSYY